MSSIGEFRKGEIDGKPFYIYDFLSPIDIPTSSSSSSQVATDSGGDNNLPLQPLFVCPKLRLEADKLQPEEYLVPDKQSWDISPLQYLLYYSDNRDDICKLAVSPLFWCNNKEPNYDEFCCGACELPDFSMHYYLCVTCGTMFHKECVESPQFIKSPSYYSLSIQLLAIDSDDTPRCIYCDRDIVSLDYHYHFPSHNVRMHALCAMQPIPIVIDHPQRHPHPLSFFPKQASLACDVCGLIKDLIPTYICVQCVFVVHEDCIYFPKVIQICRHHHRISFTSSLPSGNFSCGVCHKKVDNECGAYHCSKCDEYFVHSRCATREDLWDGEDLEGVPEEPEIVVEPFERIADGIILHFSHGHHLELKVSRVYDADKFCQGCILPVYEGCYYSCMDQCDFILHESCANATLKKFHPLHPHPVELKVSTELAIKDDMFRCTVCARHSCGFVYECLIGDCEFQLDVRCASVSEPFDYQGHAHPLFLALNPEEQLLATCQICEHGCKNFWQKLNCIECDYTICFSCATLPSKARYKHDKHLLTFHKEKEASDGQTDWCDVCERKIVYSRKGGYYSCDDCCTTLHVHCLLGRNPYLKPGQSVTYYGQVNHTTHQNNTMTRPFCHGCKHRCPDKLVFKSDIMTFCSVRCLSNHLNG